MGKWIKTSVVDLKSLHEPYSYTVPSFHEFFVFSKSAWYSDINGILNPEAERECQNHLVQALTVQMGSTGRKVICPAPTEVWWQYQDRDLTLVSLQRMPDSV